MYMYYIQQFLYIFPDTEILSKVVDQTVAVKKSPIQNYQGYAKTNDNLSTPRPKIARV